MKQKSTSQSGILNTRVLIAVTLCSLSASLGWLSFAANPPSGTLSIATPFLTYTTGPNVQSNPSGFAGTLVCNAALPCDEYTLTVDVPAGTGTTHNVIVTVSWDIPAEDYDLYVLQGATEVQSSASSADPEVAVFDANPGVYTVRVVPFAVAGSTFMARIQLVEKAAVPPPPPPPPGTPRYHNFAATGPLGNGAGEPTLGAGKAISGQPGGRTMYIAGLETLRVTWNDCSSPASSPAFPASPLAFDPLWEDKSFLATSVATIDPILFSDFVTGRTFVSQLGPKTSFLAYTDNDGGEDANTADDYIQSQGSGINSGVDHQTVGGGVFRPGLPDGINPLYANAVYYASQDAAIAQMALSRDGGQTFGPAVPMYNLTQCGGLHGHIKVAPASAGPTHAGTVYIPNKGCSVPSLGQGLVVSEDEGLNFSIRVVPGSIPGDTDPSVAVDAAGKIYFAYANGDGRAMVAVSNDKGVTWEPIGPGGSNSIDVGGPYGIKNTVFPAAVAGDAGRAAVMYLATDTAGGYEAIGSFTGVWHIYVAHTFDGGATWTTVRVTPENDPVQRGSICTGGLTCGADRNLLDFNDMQVDHEGRVIIAYADGCVGCTSPTGADSRAEKATIARQSGGKRLFAAFDPADPEPNPPAAPLVKYVFRDENGFVRVIWAEPDNGSATLTGYNVYRRESAGTYGAPLATLTAAKTSYDDPTADPDIDYFYKVTAVNSEGEGTNCGEFPIGPAPLIETPCLLPGVTLLTDPEGDSTTVAPPRDILKVSAAELYDPAVSANKLFLTMKVGNLTPTAPPESRWSVFFTRVNPPDKVAEWGATTEWFVTLTTESDEVAGNLGVPPFKYGHVMPGAGSGGLDLLVTDGTLDGGSQSPDGSILYIISNPTKTNTATTGASAGRNFPALQTGEALGNVHASTQQVAVAVLIDDDSTGSGNYTLVGNAFCRPNLAPIPALIATPISGDAPLQVSFDASGSFDPDAGDTVASYTFTFGDGSQVTQAAPTIQHTYYDWGFYSASVRVTDSRGKVSSSVADVVIDVGLPLTDIVSTKVHGSAGAFPIVLPTDGAPGVECRTGGTNNDHTIVYTFDRNLTGVGSATVSQGTGTVNTNSGIGPAPNQYTVNLTGVANAQHLVVKLDGVQDAGGAVLNNVLARMDVLYCDVNSVSGVTGSDVNIAKSQVGLTLSMDNFRNDVNVTGFVSGSDVNIIKSQVGMTLPSGSEPSSAPEPASPAPAPGRIAPPAKSRPASGVRQTAVRTDRPAPVSEQ